MNFYEIALKLGFISLTLSLLFVVYRIVVGPTLPDRVVGLDLLAILSAAAIALHAIAEDQPIYLDVSIMLTLMAFIGTIGFARFILSRAKSKKEAR